LIFIFIISMLLVGLFLVFFVSTIIHSCIKELFQVFFSFYWRVHVFSEWRMPKSNPLRHLVSHRIMAVKGNDHDASSRCGRFFCSMSSSDVWA
jgi:hypothetical protein